jgi:phosphate:Na+ symporter
MAKEILKMEDEINELESEFREEHINRLKKGICLPEADVIFTESMRNLERIGDHSDNIAHSILTE